MRATFETDLIASGPHPDLADRLGLYGRFVGSWDLDVVFHELEGSPAGKGTWTFAWVLDGRSIQDVWRAAPADSSSEMCGSTIRSFDPSIDAWQIEWVDPSTGTFRHMVGKSDGDEIVQDGVLPDGRLMRWRFFDIGEDSFNWSGAVSSDAGATWETDVSFTARRRRS